MRVSGCTVILWRCSGDVDLFRNVICERHGKLKISTIRQFAHDLAGRDESAEALLMSECIT